MTAANVRRDGMGNGPGLFRNTFWKNRASQPRAPQQTMPAPDKAISVGSITIPARALQWQFSRSQGPGGQNVNKTNTKVELRLDLQHADFLPAGIARRLRLLAGSRTTSAGEVVITSQRFREQQRNIADCLAKLSDLLAKALVPPTIRRATKPSRASQKRRLDAKRRRSETKQMRRRVAD
jgi:ribosome-associated protein